MRAVYGQVPQMLSENLMRSSSQLGLEQMSELFTLLCKAEPQSVHLLFTSEADETGTGIQHDLGLAWGVKAGGLARSAFVSCITHVLNSPAVKTASWYVVRSFWCLQGAVGLACDLGTLV